MGIFRYSVALALAVCLMVSLLCLAPAQAQNATPSVRGQVVGNFARITFDWPSQVKFSTRAGGNSVTVTFSEPSQAAAGNAAAQLSPYVTGVKRSADGRSYTFSLDKNYRTRSFMSGTTSGIDIIGIDPARRGEKSAKAETPEPVAAAAPPASEALPAPQELIPVQTAAIEPDTQPDRAAAEMARQKKAETEKARADKAKADKAKADKQKAEKAKADKIKAEAAKAEAAKKQAQQQAEAPSPESTTAPAAGTVPAPEPAPVAAAPVVPEVSPAAAPVAAAPAAATSPTVVAQATQPTVAAPAASAPAAAAPVAKTIPVVKLPRIAPVKMAVPNIGKSVAASVKTIAPLVAKANATAQAAPVAKVEAKPAAPAQTVTPSAQTAITITGGEQPQLRFPWGERVAAAVFVRGGYLWVLFNKPGGNFSEDVIAKPWPDTLGKPEMLASDSATIIRFPLRQPVFPVTTKAENSSEWIVKLAKTMARPKERVRVTLNTEPPLKPHIFLPVLETSDPITVRDPIVGDTLQITPFFKPSVGFMPARHYVEFSLLQTAQGMVVVPHADSVRIGMMRNGIKLTTPEGVSLNPDLPKLAMDDPDADVSGGPTLFPYEKWKLKNQKDFIPEKQRLYAQVIAGQGDNASYARLKLLQLHLAEGMFTEALGMAETIEKYDPGFYTEHKIAAYRGASNLMLFRTAEAARNFAAPELSDVAEMELWRSLPGLLSGDASQRFDFVSYNDAYISKYPPGIRQKLAIIGADTAIGEQEYNTALKIFDSLNKDKIIGPIQNYVDYLIGKISSETGQTKVALQLWERLAEDYKDGFIRSRAEFSMVNLMLQQNQIKRDEAIARLERLRVVWRGDTLELNLLMLLGNLYIEEKRYAEGLRAYRDIVNYFPSSPEALPTAQKMAEIFNYLFNQGGADKIPTLSALALYYEFQSDLAPTDSAGEKMIRNLADRLVSVDLLDRAAGLLDHQVRFRLQSEERSRVGARLALIYLFNHQPKEALRVLETTGYGQNPPELQRTRNHLTALALQQTGSPDAALAVLQDDTSADAQLLRVDIHWDTHAWKPLIATAEAILGTRQDPSKPLSDVETAVLLKLATAYTYERDVPQLQYLKDYFLPLLAGNPQRSTFLFIASGSEPVDHKNLQQVTQEISSIQNYLSNYRNRMAGSALSQAIQ